jgi:hypothetical protein
MRGLFLSGLATAALLLSACGDTAEQRTASGGLGSAPAAGTMFDAPADPVGAIVGGAMGATGGTFMDERAEDGMR